MKLHKHVKIIIILLGWLFLNFIMIAIIQSLNENPTEQDDSNELVLTGPLPQGQLVYINLDNDITFLELHDGSMEIRQLEYYEGEMQVGLSWYTSVDAEGDIWVRIIGPVGDAGGGIPLEITTQGEILWCRNAPSDEYRVSPIGGDQILVIDAGRDPHDIAVFNMANCTVSEPIYSFEEGYINEVMQSSTGMLAVWQRSVERSNEIQIVSPEGENLLNISNASSPTWSHDGNQLIFIRQENRDPNMQWQIWLYDLRSNQSRILLDLETNDLSAVSFSPDDTEIVFSDYGEISIYNIQTSQIRLVREEPFEGTPVEPCWR